MAGAANTERVDAFINEVTAGTTPATPAFTKASFDFMRMTANPRISESFPSAVQGQRLAIGRNGISVAGVAEGNMIYGEYDDWFASLFQADWSTDVLVNGTGQNTLTVEQQIPEGAGGTIAYTRFLGVEAATGSITMTAREDVRVAFDLLGSGSEDATPTAISGATYNDPTNTDIIGSGADIGSITLGSLTVPCIQQMTVNFGVAEKEEQPRIASDDACGITRGAMRPSINTNFYIEQGFLEIYNAARSGVDFNFSVRIGQVSGSSYTLEFPACQFSEAPVDAQAAGSMFQPAVILPKYDSGIGGTCRLTRAV